MIAIIIIAIVLFVVIKVWRNCKIPKLGSFNFVSGAVKSGKSSLTLAMALKEYKRNLKAVKRYNHFFKYLDIYNRSKENLELPLLYSNIPLKCNYVPITQDLLLRKERFAYASVVFIDEASLVADSQLIKDKDINEQLLLFSKLIGHELGSRGKLFINSQCINDVHYSFKRVMSNYIYVHSCRKMFLLPFVKFQVRELFYSDDNSSTMNVFNEDVEDSMKTIIVSSKFRKMFDSCCYSSFTDDLPVNTDVVYPTSLKASNIISFRNYEVSRNDQKHV